MTHTWPLQESEHKLNEVVEAALADGPQVITQRGTEMAIVLAYEDYRKLLLSQKKLSEFFKESPLAGAELDLTRDTSAVRSDLAL